MFQQKNFGLRFIGIEREAEYVIIAETRLNAATKLKEVAFRIQEAGFFGKY